MAGRKVRESKFDGSVHVTNRNRKLLEHRYSVDIPKDVDYILIGDAFDDYMNTSIDTIRSKKDGEESSYEGIEFID